MGKMIYRMCLLVVLMIVVAGGVYYYLTFAQEEEDPEKGTFVDRMDDWEDPSEEDLEQWAV